MEHQSVFDSLLGTSYEWLHKLVNNLAFPNIKQFNSILSSSKDQLEPYLNRSVKNGKPLPQREHIRLDEKLTKFFEEKVKFKVLYDAIEEEQIKL